MSGAVTHLQHIDELARILRPNRIEEDRARFRSDDCYCPRSGPQQALSEHQGIGKACAGLTKLDKAACVIEQLGDLADV